MMQQTPNNSGGPKTPAPAAPATSAAAIRVDLPKVENVFRSPSDVDGWVIISQSSTFVPLSILTEFGWMNKQMVVMLQGTKVASPNVLVYSTKEAADQVAIELVVADQDVRVMKALEWMHHR